MFREFINNSMTVKVPATCVTASLSITLSQYLFLSLRKRNRTRSTGTVDARGKPHALCIDNKCDRESIKSYGSLN